MKRAALAVVHGDTFRVAGGAPIELRVEDRLQSLAAPIRNASTAMLAVAAGSLLIHVSLMAIAVVAARAPLMIPQQREIAVEVVQEAPKQLEAPKQKEAPKPVAAQRDAPKEPPHAEQAKPAAPQPAAKAPPPQADPEAGKVKALEDELANLRAEQAALKAQSQAAEHASGKALALPSIGTDGDAIGYQQLVFSQLIKAKGNSEYRGQAGSTGVKFEIDDTGKLIRAEVTRSSGSAALDGRALDIVHRAAPFPPPPTAADKIVFANVNFVPPKSP